MKTSPAVSLTWLASCVKPGCMTSNRQQSLSTSARVDLAARRTSMMASTCSLGNRRKCEVAIVRRSSSQPVRVGQGSGDRRGRRRGAQLLKSKFVEFVR